LDEESHRILTQRAASLKVSIHELARFYVLQLLHDREYHAKVGREIVALQQQFIQQRVDFKLAVEALLVSAGHADPKEAKAWVEVNFS